MLRVLKRQAAFFAWSCVLFTALSARAEDTTEPREYREVVRRALQQFEQGHYAEAGALFERAHQLFPNARTLWGLGVVAFGDRDYANAIVQLEAARDDSRRPLATGQRAQGEKVLKDAWEFVAGYRVKLSPSGANLSVDGKPPQTARELLLLNPGPHELVVDAPGYQSTSRRVDAKSGERRDLSFELATEQVALAEPVVAAAPEVTAGTSAQAPAPDQSGPPMWVAYTLVGTGGALLAGALVTGLISNHDYGQLETKCGAMKSCPSDFDWQAARDEGKHLALATNLLALSGVLVAGTGAVLWYVWANRDADEAPAATLACLPGACMTHVRVAF